MAKKTSPLVSVVTPCYNGVRFVSKLLDSILGQTYKHIEFIFVNDGSTDNTEEIVLSYKDKFEKEGMTFVYIYKENGGQASAINKGLKVFTGDYFIWPDSDDWLTDNSIEQRVGFLENNKEYGFVFAKIAQIDENMKELEAIEWKYPNTNDFFLHVVEGKNPYVIPIVNMVRREVLLEAIPTKEIYESPIGQNLQLLLPISYHSKAGYIDEVLGYYLVRGDSHSKHERTKEDWIIRWNHYRDCIENVMNSIKPVELEKYMKIIEANCLRREFELGFKYQDVSLMKKNYKKLKIIDRATLRDRTRMYSVQYKIPPFMLNKLILTNRRIKSYVRRTFARCKRSLRKLVNFFMRVQARCARGVRKLMHGSEGDPISIVGMDNEISVKLVGGESMLANKNECNGCHACVSICFENCISMEEAADGFLYPILDKSRCTNCDKCKQLCPVLQKKEVINSPITYAAFNKDEKVRQDSSSGGIFTLLAFYVIDNGGVVFGACFDEHFNVVHNISDKKEDIAKFRGSKYVQSTIGSAYKLAKNYLDNGRMVLFSGTPCQIGGLMAYLGKNYENLITQDFICYGVPSPKVLRKYIDYREKVANSKTTKIMFRRKDEGWKKSYMAFYFKNETEYSEIKYKDMMFKLFYRNICLRLSCHNCAFKSVHRQSDITLADFWGIENVLPHMDDGKGTSLVFVNSEIGVKIFGEIEHNLVYEKTDIEQSIKSNPYVAESVPMHSRREEFFGELDCIALDTLVIKYGKPEQSSNAARLSNSVKRYGLGSTFRKIINKIMRRGN